MPLITVTDLHDERLSDFRDLTDVSLRSALEPRHGLYMAEGGLVIERALAAGHRPRGVLVEAKRAPQAASLLAGHPQVPVYVGDAGLLRGVTGYSVHRGFLAAMQRPQPLSAAEAMQGATRVLVLGDLVDHTNVGAAFRSAAALGFDAVVVSPQCADPLYRRSIKVSMGAVLGIPWATAASLAGALTEARERGFRVLAMTPDPQAVALADLAAAPLDRVALVVGSEGPGLSEAVLRAADARVRIPMAGGVDSLNVAAATAVACYALGDASSTSGLSNFP